MPIASIRWCSWVVAKAYLPEALAMEAPVAIPMPSEPRSAKALKPAAPTSALSEPATRPAAERP